MKIRIEFGADNAAFDGRFGAELRAVLERAAREIVALRWLERPRERAPGTKLRELLRDTNGNTIGHVEVTS